MESIETKIIQSIHGNAKGWVFSQTDFADLGPRTAIDKALSRLEKKGTILRVSRGIYYYPQMGSLINEPLPPEMPKIAQALARKFGWIIVPSGATALNYLDLSTQVPAKYAYVSNGRSKTYLIGNMELWFKKGMLRESQFNHPKSAVIVQAIRALGKPYLTDKHIEKLRRYVDPSECSSILRDTRSVTAWVYDAIRKICIRN